MAFCMLPKLIIHGNAMVPTQNSGSKLSNLPDMDVWNIGGFTWGITGVIFNDNLCLRLF